MKDLMNFPLAVYLITVMSNTFFVFTSQGPGYDLRPTKREKGHPLDLWFDKSECIAHVCLCAFAGETVMLSYSMWYNIRQVSYNNIKDHSVDVYDGGDGDGHDDKGDEQAVPCPLSPEDCQWPTDFPELLDMRFVLMINMAMMKTKMEIMMMIMMMTKMIE